MPFPLPFLPRYSWASSATADPAVLAALERKMAAFYSRPETRASYQALNDHPASHQANTEADLVRAMLATRPSRVLEVGCGSGRLYDRLAGAGYAGGYTGVEMSPEVIAAARVRHPGQTWVVGSVYDAGLPAAGFDAVFSYFVLEHCVYPERALAALTGWARPGGSVFLVFPDFREQGIFPSQRLGFGEGSARALFARGRVVAAAAALIDSRLRLRPALRAADRRVGPWPVNLAPKCLDAPVPLLPDMDAVYIASKKEVQAWAERAGLGVEYPAGTDGHYRGIALMRLTVPPRAGTPDRD